MNTSLNSDSANERLISDLASALAPVRRLRPPSVRAVIWLAVVAATAVVLAVVADLPAVWHRLGGAPDMWLAVTGSTLTTILAAIAAFQLSLPDARRTWALLPLPAALLWIVASGVGCLRTWFLPGTHVGRPERGARLPHLHRRIVGAAVGITYHNAAARLPTAAER